MKKTVAVIFGGQSSEYEVSLHSTASVLMNMPEAYDVVMIGITKDGHWYEYRSDVSAIEDNTWTEKEITPAVLSVDPKDHGFLIRYPDHEEVRRVDVVFPVLHGPHGEDGMVQAVCELASIPCVGCGMISSALCMDKEYTHIVAQHAGVPMARWIAVRKDGCNPDQLFETVRDTLHMPCIIKPANAGSSFGVSKAKDKDSFLQGLQDAFQYDRKVIIEEFMKGFEVGCAVLGNHGEVMGEPDEIEIVTDIFDYTEKYNLISSQIHVPARISETEKQRVYELSSIIYQALSCTGMARIDFFVTADGVFLNELNTIPGFTSHSRYPSMLKAKGYAFARVIDELIQCALQEQNI